AAVRTERAYADEGVTAGDLHRLPTVRRPAVAELPVGVSSPAPCLTVVRDRARVHRARRDGHEMLIASNPHRSRSRRRAPVSKLAARVPPPAVRFAAGCHAARMLIDSRNRLE